MSRLAAFWEEFLKSISWVGVVAERSKKISELLLFLLAALAGVLGMTTVPKNVNWLSWLQPWSPYLIWACVVFLLWKAAIAWDRTRGPIIWMGQIETDDNYQVFEFAIQNRGEGEVIARPFAENLRDRHGKRIPRIDTEIELHCRGYYQGEKVKLFGSRRVHVAVLQANKGDAPNTGHLLLVTPASKPNYGLAPLVTDSPTPLSTQHKLYLSIRVDFFNDENKFLKTKTKKVALIPDERQPLQYRVRPTKWF